MMSSRFSMNAPLEPVNWRAPVDEDCCGIVGAGTGLANAGGMVGGLAGDGEVEKMTGPAQV